MIVLRSPELLVRLDPRHGAEILDVVDLSTGRQLLGRPPFGSEPVLGGDLDEERWTQSYRGGWQTVLPNAGNSGTNETGLHGFHGRASNDPWQVVEQAASEALCSWHGHGLEVEKRIRLTDGAVEVTYRIGAPEGASLIALEHVTAGLELIEPDVRLHLPPGLSYELNEQTGPVRPPAGAPRYPEVMLADGSIERADRWPISDPRSRLFAVADLPEGWAVIENGSRDQGMAVAWDVGWWGSLWVWHENRVSGGIWREQTEMLAVEPSTVPHSLGLPVAQAEGQAKTLAPGEIATPWIVLRPVTGVTSVRSVGRDGRLSQ